MDNWPVLLQPLLDVSGFEKSIGSTTVSTEMGVGPAKTRSRFTKGVDKYQCQITLDYSEISIFEQFYKTTLANGTLPFLFDDPFTGTPEAFRFVPGTEPSLRPLGGRTFTVAMTWERLP